MKYLIPFAMFLFQLPLMYLIWDKYPGVLSEKIFFEAVVGLVGLGGIMLISIEMYDD